MTKDKFLILEYMIPRCIICKLGPLISLSLLLFYINVFASENSYIVNNAVFEIISQEEEDFLTQPVIHINDGTVLYGLETISLDVRRISVSNKEYNKQKISKKVKKREGAGKTLKKIKNEQSTKLPEISSQLSCQHSKETFKLSKRQYRIATLNNIILKFVILSYKGHHQTIFSLNTNSLYIYSFFLKGGMSNSAFFTRPPPFV